MKFVVTQETFQGPLAVLLELLDKRQLEIKDVNLAKIAEDYLAYLDAQEVPPEEMADFLLVATRLIYLKSRELMPFLKSDEEEQGVQTLEEQLRLYRLFMKSADGIQERFMGLTKVFSRPFVKPKVTQQPTFMASKNITTDGLREIFRSILKRLEPFFALREASIERLKSVEERLEELKGAIVSRTKMKFREVLSGVRSKSEAVVSFLALLELVRRNIVRATQETSGDIEIQKL